MDATEWIESNDRRWLTLTELLRPSLRAVFVGINPSTVSVEAGHYYQGQLGRRVWSRLEEAGIAHSLPRGAEDEAAFGQGLGFADLVGVPTRSADELAPSLLRAAAAGLAARLEAARPAKIVFVYRTALDAAGEALSRRGWTVLRMPGPYAARAEVVAQMRSLARCLGP